MPGKPGSAFLLPEELRGRSLTLYEVGAGTVLLACSRVLPDHSQREELTWIDASGKVMRQAEVSPGRRSPGSNERDAWQVTLTAPSPLVLVFAATVVVPLSELEAGVAPNYATALAHSLAVFWPMLLVVTLLSAALAGYCWRRQRRYYLRASGVWFVFVLLTGVPCLVGYLFHRHWPVLEKCPACGQVVPRDRETCAQCGAAFPRPEPKGCEVFA